jgi:HEPN domain-containing protein
LLNKYTPSDLTPHKLTKAEGEHPLLILHQLFDYASLPQLREHLWHWLKLTVTNGYTKNYFHYNDRDRIITLYEFLEKLIEASYLIYSGKKEELRHLNHSLMNTDLDEEQPLVIKATNLSSPLTNSIIQLIQPAFIFHLGTVYPTINHKLPTTNYLLIILSPNPSRPLHEYESMLHNKYGIELITIIKSVNEVNRLRKKGNPFFIDNCTDQKLLYTSKETSLEEPLSMAEEEKKQQALDYSTSGFKKAQGFLKGANFFIEEKSYPLASFMLHQATEQGLSAVLYFITGYREQTHNLNKQLTYCRLWAPTVATVLEKGTEEEQNLFRLLQKAYRDSRYHNDFSITETEIEKLYKKISLLHQTIAPIIS